MMMMMMMMVMMIGLTDRVGSEVTCQTRTRETNCLNPGQAQTMLNKIPKFFFVFRTNPFLAKGKVHPRTGHGGL